MEWVDPMETRLIEYAIAVADEQSFTRAAKRVYAGQSTVSAGVRALERELGAVLFERNHRGVRITSAGESVLPALRALVEAEARARTAADPHGELRGRLRVGVFSSVSYLAVPRVIGAFHREHPLVDLRLRASSSGSAELADAVLRGRLDLSLYGLPAAAAPSGLAVHRLTTSRFAVLLPADHRLASTDLVSLQDLTGERFVDAPSGFGNRDALDAAFGRRGIVRDVAIEATETSSIPVFVANRLGIALLPEVLIPPGGDVAVVPLVEDIEWEFNVVTRPSMSDIARALLDQLLAAY